MGFIIKSVFKGKTWCDFERTLRIYLPSDYYTSETKRYPVIYMNDGQNLFEDSPDILGGVCWGIKEALERFEKEHGTSAIIAALDNHPTLRFDEYSPYTNKFEVRGIKYDSVGGYGDYYSELIVEQLKPYIDNNYRTLVDAKNTGIAGSSMGGVISAYSLAKYPEIFGMGGVFSIASWFAKSEFENYLRKSINEQNHYHQKVFVQVGTEETSDPTNPDMPQIYIDSTLDYIRILAENGVPYKNISLHIGQGKIHSEKSWSNYMDSFFRFLLLN